MTRIMSETEPIDTKQETKERAATFYLGEWYIDPSTARIKRDQTVEKLEPRVMQLLLYLAQHPGVVVSREELEANVWKGSVVGYEALGRAIAQLRKAFRDDPRDPQIIETLSKRGYRLIAAVRDCEPTSAADPTVAQTSRPFFKQRFGYAAILVSFLILIGAIAWLIKGGEVVTEDPRSASVAVLPFANPGTNKELAYIASGLADDMMAELTQVPGLLVIARASAFRFKGTNTDPKRIATELNVRFLLRGTIRREGSKLLINAHLTDAQAGTEVWAQRYEIRPDTLIAVQDQIIDQVVSALKIEVSPQKRRSISLSQAKSKDLAAYRLFLEARDRFYHNTKEDTQRARFLLERAIARDSSFAAAYTYLAWTHVFDTMNGWSEQREASLELALKYSNQAVANKKDFPLAYFVRGLVYRERHEFIKALVEAERAIELDPNYANGHVLLATLLYYAERPKEGLQRMQKAVRLNPLYPHNYAFHLGQAYFLLKDYERAIKAFRDGLKVNPTSERMRVWLAASYSKNGHTDDARWEVEQALITNPDLSLQKISQAFPFINPADMQPLMEGLRKAGMPN